MMDDLSATESTRQRIDLLKDTNAHRFNHIISSTKSSVETNTVDNDDVANTCITILTCLFKHSQANIALRLWNGATLLTGNALQQQPAFILVINHPKVIVLLAKNHTSMQLAQCYFNGDIDIEGDFFAAISLKDCHVGIISWRDKLTIALKSIWLITKLKRFLKQQVTQRQDTNYQEANDQEANDQEAKYQDNSKNSLIPNEKLLFGQYLLAHSKADNQAAITFHYDVSNTFYALWLDKSMVYSCAYFENKHNSLEQAQFDKLDHICKKLLLKPGDHFLDIGCGWGALICHAALHYGVIAHGITLSQQQLSYVRNRIAIMGLQHKVTVKCCDYRDMTGSSCFDKIASVGMFEHVGLKNLGLYFATVNQLLKPGGLFLNHGITHDVEGWQKTLSTEFINRYIFPDGQLDTVSNIMREMEREKFEIADCESLRTHYALTLRQWVARLELRHDVALKTVSESTYRIWRLYMAASALEFEGGELGIYQILAIKRHVGLPTLPLTRQHLYTGSSQSAY